LLVDKQVTAHRQDFSRRAIPMGARDAERSRTAILDSAERLFAERGFDGTTLAAVGSAAGLSRGAPAYFFGSKERLYRAVLGRLFESSRDVLPTETPDGDLREELTEGVRRLTAFLVARPAFLRILEWEALSGDSRLLGIPEHLATLGAAMRRLADGLERAGRDSLDARHLVLSLIALNLFPHSHPALVRDLGLDPGPSFLEDRARHTVDLVLYGVLPR
jgi:TetR/AcrR family transcriptional regulator